MNGNNTAKNKSQNSHDMKVHKTVHHVLAYSYFVYFLLFSVGVFIGSMHPTKLTENTGFIYLGYTLLFFATLLIHWAQSSSLKLRKDEDYTLQSFYRGPYKFSRSPTHWGLFLLMIALGFVLNEVALLLAGVLALMITRYYFLPKEEAMLVEKYNTAYLEYKKKVKF